MRAMDMAVLAAVAMSLGACSTMKARDKVVRTPPACTDQQVQVYFEADSSDLTSEGRAVINQAATQARTCHVTAVEVLGLAEVEGWERKYLLSR